MMPLSLSGGTEFDSPQVHSESGDVAENVSDPVAGPFRK